MFFKKAMSFLHFCEKLMAFHKYYCILTANKLRLGLGVENE